MACTETGLKMCCRPQTLTLKPLFMLSNREKEKEKVAWFNWVVIDVISTSKY